MGNEWAILAAVDETEGVDTDEVVSATVDVVTILLGVGIGLAVGLIIALLVQLLSRFALRKHPIIRDTIHSISNSFEVTLGVVGAWIGMRVAWPEDSGETETRWRSIVDHGIQIVFILALTWLVARIVTSVEDTVLDRWKTSEDSRYLRKQTQLEILNRIIVAAIWLMGVALILLTFDWGRTLGSALFTSAGLFTVVVGIAAQATLGNVFAGLQLAFSDSIRMGDIVVWEETFTTVEEITLTYVVLKSWDGRRLIVPSREMTAKTFENWTRRAPNLLGKVDFDVAWTTPIDGMRRELDRILKHSQLWDGETGLLQVTDVIGGRVLISALLSGRNSAEVTDLKLYVREEMVKWLQHHVEEYKGAEEFVPDSESGEESNDSQALPGVAPGLVLPSDTSVVDTFDTAASGPTTEDVTATQVINAADLPLLYPARVPVEQRETTEPTEDEQHETRTTGHKSSMFSGSESAERRAQEFSGPGEEAYQERDAAYERMLA
ncbi:MAG: mechanosensitive ion channel family protein, partial [Ancrocorticia sp.]|uniref:mechanosensitive ion channel family protein n=1 Tax=Ancrocorticia sp. TaxID=2593684 RepID=UPI003F923558